MLKGELITKSSSNDQKKEKKKSKSTKPKWADLPITSCITVRNIMDDNNSPQTHPFTAVQNTFVLHISFCFFINKHVERDIFLCFFTNIPRLLYYVIVPWRKINKAKIRIRHT